jgi:hypothetical protein
MGLGSHNYLIGNIICDAQITGGGAAANTGTHFILPVKARLVKAYGSIEAAAASTTITVSIIADGTAIGSISLATATTSAAATITDDGKIYDAGTEFEITQNTTNPKTVDDMSVQLLFRSFEV